MSKLDELIKNINKTVKEEIIHSGISAYDYERIPFTSPRLNYMTFGGLPVGKLVEFYGEEHGGKTTTLLDIISNFQQIENRKQEENPDYEKRKVLFLDLENSLDAIWATKLGVNLEECIILNPTNQGAETIFQWALDLIDTGEIGIAGIDSLGVMVSNQALEKTVEEKTYGGIAMALTNFSKKVEMLCNKHKCTLICLNQMRADLNSQFGGTTTTGGFAWRHNCMVRMEFRRGKFIDERGNELPRGTETAYGNYVLVSMTKNKSCPPTRRTGFYTICYSSGVDYLRDLIEVAIKYGVVDKSGAWFSILDPDTGELIEKLQGQARVYEFLENPDNEPVLKKLEDYIDSHIYED